MSKIKSARSDAVAKPKIEERQSWRGSVVPKALRDRPIHRWFVFPHSFTDDLVKSLIDEWSLGSDDLLVDPFAGAGTSILAAKELAVPAMGYDLSPLAVLASNVKIANYRQESLREHWKTLQRKIRVYEPNGEAVYYDQLIVDALRGQRLATFHAIKIAIRDLASSKAERDFFLLALLSVLPQFSRALATGGWLSWRDDHSKPQSIPIVLKDRVNSMLEDLGKMKLLRRARWSCATADARKLPLDDESCSAVITSPPYPNRHDYTRVFGVELMFGLLDWFETRSLRYQLFQSHPEARPLRPAADGYVEPDIVRTAIARIEENGLEPKIIRLLRGYFLDVYLSLREIHRVLQPHGRVAYVVGNAQYGGVPVLVDEAVAAIGEDCGLTCESIRVVRNRGNSAQQMGKFGRSPSRESIVLMTRH